MNLRIRFALGLTLLAATPAWAAACFCLVDKGRTPYYDCVEGIRGAARTPFVECRLEPGELRDEIPGGTSMTRVPAGTAPCVPCEVGPARQVRAIRTGDDEPTDSREGDQ